MVDLRSLVTFSPVGVTATVYDLDWAINSQTNVQLTGAVVKGLSEGTATVTATLPGSKNGNGGTVTKTLQVKVKPDPNVMVRIIYKDAQQVDTVTRVIFVPVASTSYAPSLSYTAVCPANHGAFYIGHIGGKLVTNARCYNILRHNSGHSNIYWANSQNDVMYAQNFTIRFSTRTEYAFDIPLSIKNDYRDVQVPRGNYFVFFMEGTGHVRGYIDNVNNVDHVHGMNKLLWVDLDYLNPITVPGGDKRVVLEFNERWNTAAVRQSYDYPIIGD